MPSDEHIQGGGRAVAEVDARLMCSTLLLKRLTVVMTEPTSQCCIARIGAAAPDLESRLVQWAGANCRAHCVVKDSEGGPSLYLQRKEAKTARAMQSLLRTLTSRWGSTWAT